MRGLAGGPALKAKPQVVWLRSPHPDMAAVCQRPSPERQQAGRGCQKTGLGSWPFSSPEGPTESVHQAHSPRRHHHRHYDQCYSSQLLFKICLQPQYYLQSSGIGSLVHNPVELGFQNSPTMGNPISIMEHYSAIKKNKPQILATIWMHLKRVMLKII